MTSGTLPQGHVWFSALAQRPQSPAWHTAVQMQRPHCNVFMQGLPHWKSRSSHDLVSVLLPHLQLYVPATCHPINASLLILDPSIPN